MSVQPSRTVRILTSDLHCQVLWKQSSQMIDCGIEMYSCPLTTLVIMSVVQYRMLFTVPGFSNHLALMAEYSMHRQFCTEIGLR